MDVDLQPHADILSPVLLKRLVFVQRENQRVLAAVTALREEDWDGMGTLLFESHDGLRDEYEVSCPELDFLVDYSRNTPEILGARMMGGGFGGCTINLVKGDLGIAFQSTFTAQYRAYFGFEPTFISVFPGPGGQLFEL
jgi:galactokinase